MNIHHDHHSPPQQHKRFGRNVLIGITASVIVMIAEVAVYAKTGSLALLGDAGHMLVDVSGLTAAYIAMRIASRPADPRATFGYKRAEVLAAMLQAMLLFTVAALLLRESFTRFGKPLEDFDTKLVIIVGFIGLATNVVTAYLLHADSKENINVKGAFLDVVGDGLASIAVIVGTFLVMLTGDTRWDTIVSVLIAAIIIVSATKLLRQTASILLERAPPNIDPTEVKRALEGHRDVLNVHDLHLWSHTAGENSLTAHITIKQDAQASYYNIAEDLEDLLRERFNLTHTTIQIEPEGFDAESEAYDPLHGTHKSA